MMGRCFASLPSIPRALALSKAVSYRIGRIVTDRCLGQKLSGWTLLQALTGEEV
jgi:hypothetical protein